MRTPLVSLALALVPIGAVACSDQPVPFPAADAEPGHDDDGEPGFAADRAALAAADAGAPVCAPRPRTVRADDLGGFAPFVRARAAWATSLRAAAASRALPPRPPLLGPADALTFETWSQYVNAELWAGEPVGYHPFGIPPYVAVRGDETRLAESSSLILAGESPAELVRLTDFSTGDGAPRVAAVCDAYLAADEEPAIAALRHLCHDLGTVVASQRVSDLKVDGIKLVHAEECGLPSMAYGAFRSEGNSGPLAFDWPDFLSRPAAYRQPCVGVYLHVEARDRSQAVLGEGWLFAKAVADLTRVPFPYRERDADHGAVAGRDGAPRGEFVSSRQLFTSGASLYLGASPLWLLHRDQLRSFDDLVAAFEGDAPACDLGVARPATPCTMPAQLPFLFPTTSSAVWLRQALDALHPQFEPGSDRNRSEDAVPSFLLGDAFADVLRFFSTTVIAELAPAALGHAGEQLGALFHAFRLYQGQADMQRLRTPLLSLGDGYYLGVPDQGYFQIGTPTPAALAQLEALDLSAALDDAGASCSPLFTFSDLITKE